MGVWCYNYKNLRKGTNNNDKLRICILLLLLLLPEEVIVICDAINTKLLNNV